MTYTKSWTWTLLKAQIEETLTEGCDRALLELLWPIEEFGHVVGLLQLKLRKSLLLLGDYRLLSRRDLVRYTFSCCRLRLFLSVRNVLQSSESCCDTQRLFVKEPKVSHLLRQVVADELLALDDFEDTLSHDFDWLSFQL